MAVLFVFQSSDGNKAEADWVIDWNTYLNRIGMLEAYTFLKTTRVPIEE